MHIACTFARFIFLYIYPHSKKIDASFYTSCRISLFKLTWIKKNHIPDETGINLKGEVAIVIAAPASTNIAMTSMPEDLLSFAIAISKSQAYNGLSRYLRVPDDYT